MKKIVLAAAVAAVAFAVAPLSGVITPAKAQVDVRVGDRDRDYDRDRDHHRGLTIGLGERHHCRTVITKIHRDGREIVKRERRCGD
jgi:Ni/Co efflux regulator RcnB